MAPSSGRAILFVRDEGPGIPDDKIASMFDPFVRLSPQASGGFGLGLAIARRAVMALGGRISARNRSYHGRPVNGLEVQIDLPLYRGGEKG